MEEQKQPEWNLESAQAAYGVIAVYVEHAQAAGAVIALLASALGEERVTPIAQSPYWQNYMASKRAIADAKADIDRLTALLDQAHAAQES